MKTPTYDELLEDLKAETARNHMRRVDEARVLFNTAFAVDAQETSCAASLARAVAAVELTKQCLQQAYVDEYDALREGGESAAAAALRADTVLTCMELLADELAGEVGQAATRKPV